MDRFADNNTTWSLRLAFARGFKARRARAIYLAARCLFLLADETDSLEFFFHLT